MTFVRIFGTPGKYFRSYLHNIHHHIKTIPFRSVSVVPILLKPDCGSPGTKSVYQRIKRKSESFILRQPLENFWSLSSAEVCKALSCSVKGLSVSEAEARIQKYGPNTLKANTHSSAIKL